MENEITKFKVNIGGTDLEYEGTEKFLKSDMQKLLEIVKRSHNKEVKAELLDIVEDLQRFLIQLNDYSKDISQTEDRLKNIIDQFNNALSDFLVKIQRHELKEGELMDAAKEMQEMNQRFNLQYLQLEQDMQNQNRQFTLVSNVMKVKHDTAKSAINNVR